MAGFKIQGIDKLLKDVQKGADPEKIKKVIRQNGADLQKTMKGNAVFTGGYSLGDTQTSISLEVKDGGMTVEVGPETDYSMYLEFGTRFMRAQPFVWKSLNQVAPQFIKDLEGILE